MTGIINFVYWMSGTQLTPKDIRSDFIFPLLVGILLLLIAILCRKRIRLKLALSFKLFRVWLFKVLKIKTLYNDKEIKFKLYIKSKDGGMRITVPDSGSMDVKTGNVYFYKTMPTNILPNSPMLNTKEEVIDFLKMEFGVSFIDGPMEYWNQHVYNCTMIKQNFINK